MSGMDREDTRSRYLVAKEDDKNFIDLSRIVKTDKERIEDAIVNERQIVSKLNKLIGRLVRELEEEKEREGSQEGEFYYKENSYKEKKKVLFNEKWMILILKSMLIEKS